MLLKAFSTLPGIKSGEDMMTSLFIYLTNMFPVNFVHQKCPLVFNGTSNPCKRARNVLQIKRLNQHSAGHKVLNINM